MKHNILIDGLAFRLRPVALDDAEFILQLRTDPELSYYIHSTSNRIEDQINYLTDYFSRDGDYYFIVERISSGEAEGVVAIYDIDNSENCGEWGRWIIKNKSLATVESVLLIYRAAFEYLDLNMVYCRTTEANERAVSFQDSTGVERYRIIKDNVKLETGTYNSVEHRLYHYKWPDIKPKLEAMAAKINRLLMRS